MGAGPTKEQVSQAIRRSLQQARRDYGGTYIKGGKNWYPTLTLDGKWTLYVHLQRASNGEACLIFHATVYENGRVHYCPHKLNVVEAMNAAGIPRLAQ